MKLKITIDGKTYDVDIEAEEEAPQSVTPFAPALLQTPTPIAPPPPAAGPAGAADDTVCRSPIVGVVLSVNVHEGQQVHVDDPMLVLEAMKMETSITSPVSARIKRLLVHAGESVQAGQVLVEFE